MRKFAVSSAAATFAMALAAPALGAEDVYQLTGFGNCAASKAHTAQAATPETARGAALATIDKWLGELKGDNTAIASTPQTYPGAPRNGG